MKTLRIKYGLAGNPDATMADARSILKTANTEAGGPTQLRIRQGAEKTWLAVSTAADAMSGPVKNAAGVFSAFKRAWGAEGDAAARDVEAALHRGCFYSDSPACTPAFVRERIKRVGKLLSTPIRDSQIRKRGARVR